MELDKKNNRTKKEEINLLNSHNSINIDYGNIDTPITVTSKGRSSIFDNISVGNTDATPAINEEDIKQIAKEKAIKTVNETISSKEFNKEIEELIKEKIKEKTEKLKDDLDKRIDKAKISAVEALALFAAFFTFMAVNVQIFTKVDNLKSAMLFTILLLGCLGFFAILINSIIKNDDIFLKLNYRKLKIDMSNKFFLILLFLMFIFIGLYFGNEELNQKNNPMLIIENGQNTSLPLETNVNHTTTTSEK